TPRAENFEGGKMSVVAAEGERDPVGLEGQRKIGHVVAGGPDEPRIDVGQAEAVIADRQVERLQIVVEEKTKRADIRLQCPREHIAGGESGVASEKTAL